MNAGNLIAIVDDDESVRDSLKGLLRSIGFSVAVFASAEAFLSSPERARTTCIIADVCMPQKSGPELQRELQLVDDQTPIVFITARRDDILRAQALSAGAIAWVMKPFSEETILATLQMALESRDSGNKANPPH